MTYTITLTEEYYNQLMSDLEFVEGIYGDTTDCDGGSAYDACRDLQKEIKHQLKEAV